jgi:DNA-binding winged helix-turn-helix (wHTH) protein
MVIMKVYKFSNCYLDTIERRVFKNGQLIEITSRAFDILQLLVESAGKVVTKADLIEKVWYGSFVEEGNIPVQISKLRKILGASKAEPFIETVSGVGYHFVARVSIVSEGDWKKFLESDGKILEAGNSDASNFDSLAVLPFQNTSNSAEVEYLTEGLTESIINNLSYVPEIRVLARNTVFRFKDSTMDTQEIGRMLGVSVTVSGRVKIVAENIVVNASVRRHANLGAAV